MSNRISAGLAGLSLGQAASIEGVRVVRVSLFGYQVGAARELLDEREATQRIAGAVKRAPVRVARCIRCGGDGLGRRDRGACGLCHGPGIQLVVPPDGWVGALPAELGAAVDQALLALGGGCPPRAQESLRALLVELLPLAPAELHARAAGALTPRGLAKTAPTAAGLQDANASFSGGRNSAVAPARPTSTTRSQ